MVNEGRAEKGRELEVEQREEFAILEQHPCGLLPLRAWSATHRSLGLMVALRDIADVGPTVL